MKKYVYGLIVMVLVLGFAYGLNKIKNLNSIETREMWVYEDTDIRTYLIDEKTEEIYTVNYPIDHRNGGPLIVELDTKNTKTPEDDEILSWYYK